MWRKPLVCTALTIHMWFYLVSMNFNAFVESLARRLAKVWHFWLRSHFVWHSNGFQCGVGKNHDGEPLHGARTSPFTSRHNNKMVLQTRNHAAKSCNKGAGALNRTLFTTERLVSFRACTRQRVLRRSLRSRERGVTKHAMQA